MESLHRLFYCRGCSQWYRLEKTELIPAPRPPRVFDLQVRSGLSEWKDDKFQTPIPVRAAQAWVRWFWKPERRLWSAGIAAAVAVGLTAVLVYAQRSGTIAKAADRLPDALEERVPLWFDAWLAQDVERMLQLTVPSHDRQLRRWLSRSPLADGCTRRDIAEFRVRLISVALHDNRTASVSSEVVVFTKDGRQLCLPFQQIWVAIHGGWRFVPQTSSRRAAPPGPQSSRLSTVGSGQDMTRPT